MLDFFHSSDIPLISLNYLQLFNSRLIWLNYTLQIAKLAGGNWSWIRNGWKLHNCIYIIDALQFQWIESTDWIELQAELCLHSMLHLLLKHQPMQSWESIETGWRAKRIEWHYLQAN